MANGENRLKSTQTPNCNKPQAALGSKNTCGCDIGASKGCRYINYNRKNTLREEEYKDDRCFISGA